MQTIKYAAFSAAILMTSVAFMPAASAQVVTEPENMSCGNADASAAIAGLESAGSGDLAALSKDGYIGRYQMGEEALLDQQLVIPDGNKFDNNFTWSQKAYSLYGIRSNADFFANEAAQEAIHKEYQRLNLGYLGSALNSVGQPLPCGGSMSQAALLAGSQLGHVKVKNYVNNGMKCVPGKGSPTNDGNGTCVEKFMCAVSGCKAIEKDMSKKTCDVTMPMIEGISCSNMPGSLRSFCSTYRPYLMTRAECQDAEEMAKAAPKGPHAERCENLSFGVGSGSWSFVLACSYASEAPADQDGHSEPKGPVTDPACIENLRGMGVQFDVLGQVYNGTASGKACYIENAVALTGTAVPFGSRLTMSCDMAIAVEKFGQQLKGMGVTGYITPSTTVPCRPMRDATGDKVGTVSEHGIGRAMDFMGVYVGGQQIHSRNIHNKGTAHGAFMSQIKSIACSTFRGVLSPEYPLYKGKYDHFHVEWGRGSFCR